MHLNIPCLSLFPGGSFFYVGLVVIKLAFTGKNNIRVKIVINCKIVERVNALKNLGYTIFVTSNKIDFEVVINKFN